MQQQRTISQSNCDMCWKVDFMQPVMTSSVVELRRSSKALSKTKVASEKGRDHYLVVCCLSDPLQLSECRGNHYIWEVCSADRWDAPQTSRPAASTDGQNDPVLLHDSFQLRVAQPVLQKLDELGHEVLPQPPYSPDLLPTDYHFFKRLETFCRENASTSSRRQKKKKMLSKSSSNPEAWIFIFWIYFSIEG